MSLDGGSSCTRYACDIESIPQGQANMIPFVYLSERGCICEVFHDAGFSRLSHLLHTLTGNDLRTNVFAPPIDILIRDGLRSILVSKHIDVTS